MKINSENGKDTVKKHASAKFGLMPLKFSHRDGGRSFFEGQEIVLLSVVVLLWIVMSLLTDTFATKESVFSILYGVAPIAIIGIAMTTVMVTSGIDVSVGSSLAVVMVVVGRAVRDYEVSMLVALLIAILVGAVLGLMNGFLIAYGRVPAMVCTFGTLNVFRWLALQIFGDNQIAGVPDTFSLVGGSISASFLGIPNAMWVSIVLALCVWFYMRNWPQGRHLYAIGNDPIAARLAGIDVKRRTLETYVLTGVAVGFAAVISVGNGGLIQQNVGYGVEMSVIAACVIGGTSVLGGRGTVLGTLLGAILVGSVQAAAIHLGFPSQMTDGIVGFIILVAVGADLLHQRKAKGK